MAPAPRFPRESRVTAALCDKNYRRCVFMTLFGGGACVDQPYTKSHSRQAEADRTQHMLGCVMKQLPPIVVAWQAFSVHLLTASGALWALLALLAAAEHDWAMMFGWLGIALIVDGLDGPLARAVKITERLPNWSGAALDFVIDYATYVLVPAFALANAGLLATPYHLIAAGLIVISGALYFAYGGMKMPDNSFRGFPVTWNMLAFDMMVFTELHAWTFAIVVVFVILTFMPIKFIHPVRVKRLRPFNLAMTAVWLGCAFIVARNDMTAVGVPALGLAISSFYLLGIGALFQLTERNGGAPEGE